MIANGCGGMQTAHDTLRVTDATFYVTVARLLSRLYLVVVSASAPTNGITHLGWVRIWGPQV